MLEPVQCDLDNVDPLARVGDAVCWSSASRVPVDPLARVGDAPWWSSVNGDPVLGDADAPCCSSVGRRAWVSVSNLVDDEEERRSSVDGEGGRRLQGKIEGGRGRKREARR